MILWGIQIDAINTWPFSALWLQALLQKHNKVGIKHRNMQAW